MQFLEKFHFYKIFIIENSKQLEIGEQLKYLLQTQVINHSTGCGVVVSDLFIQLEIDRRLIGSSILELVNQYYQITMMINKKYMNKMNL